MKKHIKKIPKRYTREKIHQILIEVKYDMENTAIVMGNMGILAQEVDRDLLTKTTIKNKKNTRKI